jgi:glycine dehydrogenase
LEGPLDKKASRAYPRELERATPFLEQDLFHRYRSETEMMRYIKKLERRDFSLTNSMIPLGSCTMKLNAAVEMLPLSWPGFNALHPFVPTDQCEGFLELINELESYLTSITRLPGVSLMPNSGAAGEYTGLMVIREHFKQQGQEHRDIVLIPASAHGTNPASAIMAGMKVVVVKCDKHGNIDMEDLEKKAMENAGKLAAFMVTYPSTHGVFEPEIKKMNDIIHQHGGQVYMDGANMNAQIGLTDPKLIGADVCHLNLHKTFAIPHGGGGPGVGPIVVAEHLKKYLPSHVHDQEKKETNIPAIAAAPFGSAGILSISYAYIRLLGAEGLTQVSKLAILNTNYLAASLDKYFPILYKGTTGRVGHEMILDCRPFKAETGITETDIAKRLIDYGFHAPTLSFPVHGTLMVEPTESESFMELNRFVEAMKSIYNEIMEITNGKADREDNVLKNAPHTDWHVSSENWEHPYSRKQAAYPLDWIKENKFWPAVRRLDDAYGDRNLQCACTPIDEYRENIFRPLLASGIQ